ncbi:MAG: hypothetical protein HYX78_06475 [Armatimonadetes bacterium]|nr:hypothetical protein [Armatimonadota bacterium]
MKRRMGRCLLAAVLCLSAAVMAVAVPVDGAEGEVISQGMLPYSETWGQMLQRDEELTRAIRAGIVPAPPLIQAIPNPLPPVVPSEEVPAEEDVTFAAPTGTQPLTIDTSFVGIGLNDQWTDFGGGAIPPDTNGAVGPDHFMVVINGSVAIYDKAGNRLSHVRLNTFFTATIGGITYPRNGAYDPRVIFDRRSNRWFAITLEFGNPSRTNNHIILAVCRTADPTTGVWDRYVIPVGEPNSGGTTFFTDFDTFGMDDNGVYFAAFILFSGGRFAKIAATGKASLVATNPSLGTVWQWSNLDPYGTPQPAHNHDAVGSTGRAWIVNSSTAFADIQYRTITWSGGTPTLSAMSTLSTSAFGSAKFTAPASGSTTEIEIFGGHRLQTAVIRNNRLWTCRDVGVNSSGGASGADRNGCEWLEVDVSAATPSLVQSGRVYDTSATNPRFYYYSSIMVNGQGHAVMGFSGSSSNEFVGAYVCGRLASDPAGTMGQIAMLHAGEAAYTRLDGTRNRWGDYSYTCLDPDDGSIWTIQEYASNAVPGQSVWGTWVGRLDVGFRRLTNDMPHGSFYIPGDYQFHVDGSNWAAVGILPYSEDHDIQADNNYDFSSPYTYSNAGSQTRDFIVVNGHTWGSGTHYARVYYGNPTAYWIEGEWNINDLVDGAPHTGANFYGLETLDTYEVYLYPGQKHTVIVDADGDTADAAVFVYPPNVAQGSRATASWVANATGPGEDESMVFTPSVEGFHGIVVTNENGGASSYTIGVGPTPPNDERAGAFVIDSLPYGKTQVTYFATKASDDPAMSCGADVHSRSVWFKFTAPMDAEVQAETFGSTYDTVLAVFRDNLGVLDLVTCNDDYGAGRQSMVNWTATGGVTYYIEVVAYRNTPGGDLDLDVSYVPPANDACSSPTVITGTQGGQNQSTLGATFTTGESVPSCVSAIHNTVWFTWTAPDDGHAVFSTYGSDFDTIMAVYMGPCGSQRLVICSDDAIGSGQRYSALAFEAQAGQEYKVQVGGYYSTSAGQLRLRYRLGPVCTTIARSKMAEARTIVTLCDAVVSAAPQGIMTFVQEMDRSAGIGISNDTPSLALGTRVTVVGDTAFDNLGNVYLTGSLMAGNRSLTPPKPLGMSNRSVGGETFYHQLGPTGAVGLNNCGLYVCVWGKVTQVVGNTYRIDDGSGVEYLPGFPGVLVYSDGANMPSQGEIRVVTGIPFMWDPVGTPVILEVSSSQP